MVFKMGELAKDTPRRVLIASANPLFGKGLRTMLQRRWGKAAQVVGLVNTMEETLQALEDLQPDLVILDIDDRLINREEFLNRFVTGERTMQVILVSLKESGRAVLYDRRNLTPAQAENWLAASWLTSLFSASSEPLEGRAPEEPLG